MPHVASCPCGSGKTYSLCCKPYHRDKLPESALKLMRSRYTAYALGLTDYIMHTTHPDNPRFNSNFTEWAQSISSFSKHTEFRQLEILDSQEHDQSATVTFRAHLFQNGKDVSFTEKSSFEKVDGKWLYKSGTISP